MQQDYTYAVARIRCRETRLLSDTDLNVLLSAKDSESVLRLLRDKGWGDNTSDDSAESMLNSEEKKLWSFIDEIVPDKKTFDFLLVPNDFHNLKVAVKSITRDQSPDDMFIGNCTCDPVALYDSLKRREYEELPGFLTETAKSAMTVLLETSDGQLCDVIVDRACMDYVRKLGSESDSELIGLYCDLFIAASDIKIAVRSSKTGKSLDFIRRSLAECDSLDVGRLAAAASMGYGDILSYLNETKYADSVEALGHSMSAFEKWCDDHVTDAMKSQKWEPFTVGPVVAYIIARQNEIKAVRMILSAKTTGLPDEIIRERLRMMYV